MIDTHSHIDLPEFAADIDAVIARAKEAGVSRIFVPATSYSSCLSVLDTCRRHPDFLFPMLGLHPEDVHSDFQSQLSQIHSLITSQLASSSPLMAVGEVGLDFYWSREFYSEQLAAFRTQVEWAIALQLPLMIHCRKAQNELVSILRDYPPSALRGVFHCFAGNEIEARQLLAFPNFLLGIGGILTFKKTNLPSVLASTVPLSRIVLETDAPYMAPVPMRGKRNESAFLTFVLQKLAEIYDTTPEVVGQTTSANVARIFPL